jgi:hypothetical protein
LTSPYNRFEVEELLGRALAELGIQEPPRDQAYRDFLYTTGRAILDGTVTPREGCTKLANAHGGDITKRELQPFWLLNLGVQDLEAGEPSWYYPGLTLENFDDLVRREARALTRESCAQSE